MLQRNGSDNSPKEARQYPARSFFQAKGEVAVDFNLTDASQLQNTVRPMTEREASVACMFYPYLVICGQEEQKVSDHNLMFERSYLVYANFVCKKVGCCQNIFSLLDVFCLLYRQFIIFGYLYCEACQRWQNDSRKYQCDCMINPYFVICGH